MRNRVTYANVTATLALLATKQIKPKSIKGNSLQPGTITGTFVKKESLTGEQIANGSLTGTEIVGSSLSNVNAATVDGKSLNCPAGTTFFVWGCWETTANAGVNWTGAVIGCANKGGVLPSAAELASFAEETAGVNVTAGVAEWTTEMTYNGSALVSLKFYEPTTVDYAPFTDNHPFRCVRPVIN